MQLPAKHGLRAALIVALAAGAGATVTAAAAAAPPSAGASPSGSPSSSVSPSAVVTPSPSASSTGWPLSANYRLQPTRVTVNEPVTLIESDVVGDQAPPAFVFRYVSWGDGTPEEFVSNLTPPKPHRYARAGKYRVSVRLENLDQTADGTFPEGRFVTVTAGAGTSPPAPGDGDGGGGGLPVTGPGAGLIAAAGAGVTLAGMVAFLTVRRRRVRFVR